MRWFRRLPFHLRSVLLGLLLVAVILGVLVGGFLAFVAWNTHQFRGSDYCREEPHDPLC